MISAVNKTAEPFAEVENGVERLNQATMKASTLVFAEQRAQNFLIATYRQKYRAVYDTLGLMRNVGAIGNQIISIVNAQNIAQIRLRDSLIDVEDAQTRVNELLEIYPEDAAIVEDALDNLEDANRRVEDAQNANKATMIGMGLTAIGTAAQIGTLITRLGELGALGALGAIGAAGTVAAATVGGLSYLATAGPPETPTPMSALLPEELGLTKEEMLAGKTYEEKFGEWRNKQITNIEVNVETDADPEQIADAVAYEIYEREREMK